MAVLLSIEIDKNCSVVSYYTLPDSYPGYHDFFTSKIQKMKKCLFVFLLFATSAKAQYLKGSISAAAGKSFTYTLQLSKEFPLIDSKPGWSILGGHITSSRDDLSVVISWDNISCLSSYVWVHLETYRMDEKGFKHKNPVSVFRLNIDKRCLPTAASEKSANSASASRSLYPNPVVNNLFFDAGEVIKTNVEIKIMDAGGKLIQVISQKPATGSRVIEFNTVQKLQPGIYFFSVTCNNRTTRHKIIKQ